IHLKNPEELFNMKFDVIVGNPPYQLSDGGAQASASPIYQLFVEQAIKLNPRYLTMIIPARWYAGGKGLDDFRSRMIADTRMRILHDYLNAADCFGTGVEIKGGVCYFLWDRDNAGKCAIFTHSHDGVISSAERYLKIDGADIFVRRNEAISILNKVQSDEAVSFSTLVSSRKPFGFDTTFTGRQEKTQGDISLFRRGGISFVAQKDIQKNKGLVKKSKLFITKAYNAGDEYPHQILNVPIIAGPDTCCSETYLVIGPFDDEATAYNAASYISTKLFRFLVSIKKISQDATQKVYEFVPIQDFSKPWTDEELYAKYGLTDEEIAFIESMIKPMDLGDADA
ncbi:MAG: Eco57I restriction-modification methylase domain-containing protein, partial [Atopobiaceae bacterium]|nr:Eco57I restriction-modification methylase domain-containing protein [Atopobiaceae bacterium]